MNKVQLFFHHLFRHIWNAIFVISYPILATFGILFVGITYLFSALSKLLTIFKRSNEMNARLNNTDWRTISEEIDLIECKVYKQIMFGPDCYHFRRRDGIPSVLEEHVFGKKIKRIEEGILLEKWNTTDVKNLPDFDICLYDPEVDKLSTLTNMKCFDWHLAQREENKLNFKWFDGTQGGEVQIAI